MDEIKAFDAPDFDQRMRYRVMLTVVDKQAGKASMQMYDANEVEVARGPQERDAFTGLVVENVRIRLPAAHALSEGGEAAEPSERAMSMDDHLHLVRMFQVAGGLTVGQDLATPLKALRLAVDLIDGYQHDIEDSAWTGVDLLEKGFCQGAIYREASQRLHDSLRRWEQEGGDSRY